MTREREEIYTRNSWPSWVPYQSRRHFLELGLNFTTAFFKKRKRKKSVPDGKEISIETKHSTGTCAPHFPSFPRSNSF